jgi:hypothetical protein
LRLKWIAALLAYIIAPVCSDAFAKDLEALTRLLVPAFISQQFAVLCFAQDAQFLSDPSGGVTVVSSFAEHVKKEVTSDLPESEAKSVRVMAADSTRNVAYYELQLLRSQSSSIPPKALKKWCDRSAKPFILQITITHREKHIEFEARLRTAKR